ncbi:MAG: hypothetical protein M5U31_09905 [Acidimicrobiia bacterium]|nr:hypothetical protein [Acidimicrobiia bacterium]
MGRRTRRVVLLLVVVAVVAAPLLFVLRAKPQLDDSLDAIGKQWAPLRVELVERYDTLDAATGAASDAGLDDALVGELRSALDDWSRSDQGDDPTVGVPIANNLEGLGARLATVGTANPRLAADEALGFSLTLYTDRAPDPEVVSAYSTAVDDYERERSSVLKRPLTGFFGFQARDDFVPSIRTS